MKQPSRRLLALALVAMFANLGCSALPTAPVLTNERAPVASGGGTTAKESGTVIPPGLIPPAVDPADLEVARDVDGTVGGVVSAGRVSLGIPGGAFDGAAVVRIVIADSTRLQCKLEITEGKNGFDQPVLLRFDAAGHGDVRTLGIFWHDETSGEWELVESSGDPETGMVEALLPHFSEYRVDTQFRTKAGW